MVSNAHKDGLWCTQQLPLMTEPFGMGSEKIYYSLIKPMLSKNVISKQA